MESQTTEHDATSRRAYLGTRTFPSLEAETRPTLPTEQAAHYLNRRPQTLRGWACKEDGPLRPIRVNGRLAWKTSDIRAVLGVQA